MKLVFLIICLYWQLAIFQKFSKYFEKLKNVQVLKLSQAAKRYSSQLQLSLQPKMSVGLSVYHAEISVTTLTIFFKLCTMKDIDILKGQAGPDYP